MAAVRPDGDEAGISVIVAETLRIAAVPWQCGIEARREKRDEACLTCRLRRSPAITRLPLSARCLERGRERLGQRRQKSNLKDEC